MSSVINDPKFWDRTNACIALANEQCKEVSPNAVSASMMYAAARFDAFIVAANAGGQAKMKAERDGAITFFTEEFRKMLVENLDDHIDNYARYMENANPA